MKKTLILPVFFLLNSCAPILNTISPITEKKVKRRGYVMERNGAITNLERFFDFKSKIENGKEDKIKIVVYSIEGDPIIRTYKSNGRIIKITSDMRKDKYGLFTPFQTTKGVFKGFKEIRDTIIELNTNLQEQPITYTNYYIAIKQFNQRHRIDTFFVLKRKI